jgi:hypothetical protein
MVPNGSERNKTMGVSMYPVLNKEVPGIDGTEVPGKALAAAVYEPNSAFAVLEQFSSMNEEELRELVAGETGQDPNGIEVPAEEWFAPEDGLTIVRELSVQPAPLVEGSPDDFAEWLANDLRALERVLALEHGALFHMAMDF